MEIVVNKLKFKNLFSLAKIIKKLDITNNKLPEGFTEMDYQQMALIAFDVVIDCIGDIEQDLYKFISDVSNIKIEDVPEMEIDDIKIFFVEFFKKNDFNEVFTQAKNMVK